MIRKNVIIVVIAVFCLTISLFMIRPTVSQSTKEYDPWLDTDDNGIINMLDLYNEAQLFGTSGIPINKTALLLELRERIDELNASLLNAEYYYNTRITNMEACAVDLQNRVNALEEKQDYVKTMRFYTPNETMNDQLAWKDAAVFVWTPHNASSNAILSGFLYFNCTNPSGTITVQVLINDGLCANTGVPNSPAYEMSYMFSLSTTTTVGLMPNQNSYMVKFRISSAYGLSAYVKDINILLEVMDGLPPT